LEPTRVHTLKQRKSLGILKSHFRIFILAQCTGPVTSFKWVKKHLLEHYTVCFCWAETAKNGHSVENFVVSVESRIFFSAGNYAISAIVQFPRQLCNSRPFANSLGNSTIHNFFFEKKFAEFPKGNSAIFFSIYFFEKKLQNSL
jgi:hypothetical protein